MFNKWSDVRIDFTSIGKQDLDIDLWISILKLLKNKKVKNLILVGKIDKGILEQIKLMKFNYYIEKVITLEELELQKKFDFIILRLTRLDLNKNIKKKLLENKNKYNTLIIDIENTCMPYHSTYWKERNIRFEKDVFSIYDINLLRNLISFLKENKKELKIINSDSYLNSISTYGITQNWKCKYFNLPTIKADGSLWICKQKPFITPISILEMNDRKEDYDVLDIFMKTNKLCDGCFQQDKFEGFING